MFIDPSKRPIPRVVPDINVPCWFTNFANEMKLIIACENKKISRKHQTFLYNNDPNSWKRACWFVDLSLLNTKFSSYHYYSFMWNVKFKKQMRQISPLNQGMWTCVQVLSSPVNWLRHILPLLTEYVISSSTVYWLRHFLLLFHRPDSPSNRKSPLLIGWLFSNFFLPWIHLQPDNKVRLKLHHILCI